VPLALASPASHICCHDGRHAAAAAVAEAPHAAALPRCVSTATSYMSSSTAAPAVAGTSRSARSAARRCARSAYSARRCAAVAASSAASVVDAAGGGPGGPGGAAVECGVGAVTGDSARRAARTPASQSDGATSGLTGVACGERTAAAAEDAAAPQATRRAAHAPTVGRVDGGGPSGGS